MGISKEIKEAVKEYEKKLLLEQKRKEECLDKDDWQYLEQLIQKCNQDPNLIVEITTHKGTKILLHTYVPPKPTTMSAIIDNNYMEIN